MRAQSPFQVIGMVPGAAACYMATLVTLIKR